MLVLAYRTVLRYARASVLAPVALLLLQMLTDMLEHSGEGQALDLNARTRRDLTLEDYLDIVAKKTGYGLTCALAGGAILGGASLEVLDALDAFGRDAMPVFQIADDLLDFTDGKGRGDIGSDIKEGKRSYLVLHTASHCSADEAAFMYDILDKPRDATTAVDVQRLLHLFRTYRAEAAARAHMAELLAKACHALKRLPPPFRDNLGLVANYLIQRKV